MSLEYFEGALAATEPLIWTPSAIKELAINLHKDILIFNEDMSHPPAGKTIPAGQLEAWRQYRNGWAKWYGDTSGSTWLWSATVSVIEDYANKLSAWREWYLQNVGVLTGIGPAIIKPATVAVESKGEQELTFDWTPVWWGAGALVVLGGGYLWWLRK